MNCGQLKILLEAYEAEKGEKGGDLTEGLLKRGLLNYEHSLTEKGRNMVNLMLKIAGDKPADRLNRRKRPKVIVAGSRNMTDKKTVYGYLDRLRKKIGDFEVVSGMAKGADSIGVEWAVERGLAVAKFPARWSTEGKSAGFLRNERMADHADLLVAFWDGYSVGTKHMIETASKKKLPKTVVKI